MTYDAIIIGGGLGGLTAGASLAKKGRKVLLLEQHYALGGCASVFRRQGFRIEVSLHELDGMDALDPKARIFAELGLADRLELLPVPSFYRFAQGDDEFLMPHGVEAAKAALSARFPEESAAIASYLELLVEVRASLNTLQIEQMRGAPATLFASPKVMALRSETLGSFLDRHFKSEKLKLILVGSISYYGCDPYELSFLYFALGQAAYIAGGGYYIKGGSAALADALAAIIREAGGEILLRREVAAILVSGHRAVGVKFRRSHGPNREETEVLARAVIANAAIPNVAAMLPPAVARNAGFQAYGAMRRSLSVTNVYFGFSRPLAELGSRHYFTATFAPDIHGLGSLKGRSPAHPCAPWMFNLVDYSQVDTGLTEAPRSVAVINMIDAAEHWAALDEAAYRREKEALATAMTSRLDAMYPGAAAATSLCEVSTPLTVERYTRNPAGSIYGFAQSPSQTWLRRPDVKSPLPGLYFASAWSRPGGGYTGAMLSGHSAAREALSRLERDP